MRRAPLRGCLVRDLLETGVECRLGVKANGFTDVDNRIVGLYQQRTGIADAALIDIIVKGHPQFGVENL